MFDTVNNPVLLIDMVDMSTGKPLRVDFSDVLKTYSSFEWDEDIAQIGEMTLKCANPDGIYDADERFEGTNKLLLVRWGYLTHLSSEETCVLRMLTPEYGADGEISLEIVGWDSVCFALQQSNPQNWGRVQTSDIAKAVAARWGMSAVVPEKSADVRDAPYVQPGNMTDLQYIKMLARRRGWECTATKRSLYYGPDRFDATPKLQARWGAGQFSDALGGAPLVLTSFKPTIDKLKRPDTRHVSIDAKKKEVATHKADDANSQAQAPDRQALGQEAVASFEDHALILKNLSPENQAAGAGQVKPTTEGSQPQVQQDAQAAQWRIHRKSVKAEAVFAPGNPEVRVGVIIEISGVATTHAGLWKVTACKHKIDPASGYTVSATLKRPGKNVPAANASGSKLPDANKQGVNDGTNTTETTEYVGDFSTHSVRVQKVSQ